MKESIARRCDFCGVPFPAEKTPYKPILGQDRKGKSLAFCCVGCAKAHEKVSRLPRTPDDSILSEQKMPFSDCAFKNPDPLPSSLPSMEPYRHLVEKAIEYGATRAIPILAKDVFIDLRAKFKCYVPICRRLP